jgi:rod shape-determining protein MreD
MRLGAAALLLYALFLVQSNLTVYGPDLVLLALVVFALHEERLPASLLGFFAGFCLDLTTPASAGAGALAFAGVGWLGATLRRLLYRSNWSATLLTAVGLVLRWCLLALAAAPRLDLPRLAVPTVLTLLLSPLVAWLLSRLFYPAWKAA